MIKLMQWIRHLNHSTNEELHIIAHIYPLQILLHEKRVTTGTTNHTVTSVESSTVGALPLVSGGNPVSSGISIGLSTQETEAGDCTGVVRIVDSVSRGSGG